MKLPNFQSSRFQIQRELGRGGMGAVYLALDRELERQVAIKILDTALKPIDYERFRREAMAVAQMQHPYIIQIYDIGHDMSGFPFFVMEYVEGKELKDLIKTNALELSELLELFKKVVKAVAHAHSKGILHRDLKPQNILIRDVNGDPCLLDFGLARIDSQQVKDSATLTAEGAVMGTLLYMSPEQADGAQAALQSDIWGLGATFYHVFTGEPPFPYSPSPYKTITSIFNLNPVVPSKLNDELPTSIDECLLNCLEKELDQRYQSAEDLLEHLESIDLNDRGDTESPSYLIPSLIIVFGALLVVGFAIYLSLGATSPSIQSAPDSDDKAVAKAPIKRDKTTSTKGVIKIPKVPKVPRDKAPIPKPPIKKAPVKKPVAAKTFTDMEGQLFLPVTKASPVFRDFDGDGVTDILLTCASSQSRSTTDIVVVSGKTMLKLWSFSCLAYPNESPLTVRRKDGVSVYVSQYEAGQLVILKLAGRTGEVLSRSAIDAAKPKARRVPSPIYRYRFNDRPYHFVIFESARNKVFLFDNEFKALGRCNPKVSAKTILRHHHEGKIIPWDKDNNGRIDGVLWVYGREIFYLGVKERGQNTSVFWKAFFAVTPIKSRPRRGSPSPLTVQEVNVFSLPNTRSQCIASIHLPQKYRQPQNKSSWFLTHFSHKGPVSKKQRLRTRYPGIESFYAFRKNKKADWRLTFGSSSFADDTRNKRVRMMGTNLKEIDKFAGQTEITKLTGDWKNPEKVVIARKNPQRVERWNFDTRRKSGAPISFSDVPEDLVGQAFVRDLNSDKVPELIVTYHDPKQPLSKTQQLRVLTLRPPPKKR